MFSVGSASLIHAQTMAAASCEVHASEAGAQPWQKASKQPANRQTRILLEIEMIILDTPCA
jgi:hypothetical protein